MGAKTTVNATTYSGVSRNNSTALKASIAKGPTSVAIEADKRAFQMYTSGVLTGSACGTNLDHGVLAVGYGTESGEEYYLVKNSWGSGWETRDTSRSEFLPVLVSAVSRKIPSVLPPTGDSVFISSI